MRIEPLTKADVVPAAELAARVLRVKTGDRGKQFAADITGQRRQMFVARPAVEGGLRPIPRNWPPGRQVRGLQLATTSAVSWPRFRARIWHDHVPLRPGRRSPKTSADPRRPH